MLLTYGLLVLEKIQHRIFHFSREETLLTGPGGIHFLTFSLQIWECGVVSCAHRLPRGSFHPAVAQLPSSSTNFFPRLHFEQEEGLPFQIWKYRAPGFPFTP